MVVDIGSPRGIDDFVEFTRERLIEGIVKFRQKALFEFLLVELNARHAFAYIDVGHGCSLIEWAMAYH
jgi:hypothetical protein